MDTSEIIAFGIILGLCLLAWIINSVPKSDELWRYVFCLVLGALFGMFPTAIVAMVLEKDINVTIWAISAVLVAGYLIKNTSVEGNSCLR